MQLIGSLCRVGKFIQCMGLFVVIFFFKQKTAYEMRISDWSSDVCSSDLRATRVIELGADDFAAHVTNLPAGVVAIKAGPSSSASDSYSIIFQDRKSVV